MEWFSHPLTDIWGIPSFWISRVAKMMQFFSGMVIVLEIVGRDRVDHFASLIRALLNRLVRARALRQASQDLWETSKYFVLYMVTFGEREKVYQEKRSQTKYDRHATVASLLLTLLLTLWYFTQVLEHTSATLWDYVGVLCASYITSLVLAYVVIINALLALIFAIVRPIEWAFDRVATLVIHVLEQRGLSSVIVFLSFALLIVSFLLDLLAS
jgi:hypothetical protein